MMKHFCDSSIPTKVLSLTHGENMITMKSAAVTDGGKSKNINITYYNQKNFWMVVQDPFLWDIIFKCAAIWCLLNLHKNEIVAYFCEVQTYK